MSNLDSLSGDLHKFKQTARMNQHFSFELLKLTASNVITK